MSLEDIQRQNEEYKKLIEEQNKKLKQAMDAIEVYTKDEIDGLIAAITEATEVTEPEIREEIAEASPTAAIDYLKKKVDFLRKVKTPVQSVRGMSTDKNKASDDGTGRQFTVGPYDFRKREWTR